MIGPEVIGDDTCRRCDFNTEDGKTFFSFLSLVGKELLYVLLRLNKKTLVDFHQTTLKLVA